MIKVKKVTARDNPLLQYFRNIAQYVGKQVKVQPQVAGDSRYNRSYSYMKESSCSFELDLRNVLGRKLPIDLVLVVADAGGIM